MRDALEFKLQLVSRQQAKSLNSNPIKFGTSGWRGIIARDFTFANVRLAAQGVAQYLNAELANPQSRFTNASPS